MDRLGRPPDWLATPGSAVLDDLQGAHPIAGLQIAAAPAVALNGLTLTILEPTAAQRDLVEMADELDPEAPTRYGGGNWVPRSMTGPRLLVLVADILQEALAETEAGWGQARPPCPHHPHPARPAVRSDEAWWICERLDEPLYRIGRGEIDARAVSATSWRPETRRKRKRSRASRSRADRT